MGNGIANLRIVTLLFVLAPTARAGTASHSTSVGPIATGGTASATLPQFDASLGVLRNARVSVLASVSGTLGFENTSAQPQAAGGYASGMNLGAYVPVSTPSGAFAFAPNPGFIPPHVLLAAFDGIADFGGASGVTHAFSNEYGDGAPGQYVDYYTDAGLAAFVGAGSIQIVLGPTVEYGPALPPGISWMGSAQVDANVTVTYEYDAFPALICRAASFSGCPCGNASTTGAGCGNSVSSAGGALAASGVASIANDTLVLGGSGMTSSNALYFQGNAMVHAQIVYGDGLRCVTGSIVRLGTKTNVGGASQYPAAGDASISVRGGVTAPGTRYYQVVYRDGGSFCTPSVFNATNGVAILWGS